MKRTRSIIVATVTALALLALFAASASATFEATMAPRKASERSTGPSFMVETGGGRPTLIHDFEIKGGRCGSIFAALLNPGKISGGFANGRGSAVFGTTNSGLKLRLELRVRPRGEGLTATGLFTATGGDCTERIPLDLVSTEIRGGGRHPQG